MSLRQLVSQAIGTNKLPGNVFIKGDGIYSDLPDLSLTTTGAFISFFILTLSLAISLGLLNSISFNTITYQGQLFKHNTLYRTVIGVITLVIALVIPITILSILK